MNKEERKNYLLDKIQKLSKGQKVSYDGRPGEITDISVEKLKVAIKFTDDKRPKSLVVGVASVEDENSLL